MILNVSLNSGLAPPGVDVTSPWTNWTKKLSGASNGYMSNSKL